MELVPAAPSCALVEFDAGGSAASLAGLLHGQKDLFHSQVEQLERLVVAQCWLTGVNPLAQEMAAGALSVAIGKRPRDLLNPKVVKCLQSLFAIKDSFGKKETREISAHCGLTATQVRDFFAGQRARVRKFARMSPEKATRLESAHNVLLVNSDLSLPINKEAPVNTGEIKVTGERTVDPNNSMIQGAVKDMQAQQEIVPSLCVQNVEGAKHHEGVIQQNFVQGETSVISEDEKFIDNIFMLMRKEETFSGQVKLLEWLLKINNSAVLTWFLTKGGLTILATWLSQAAVEEQTSVLLIILKVLCHLPLRKALPVHMSAILQTVNKLRFYRTTGISNSARVLLSRWSKLFVRSQAGKKFSTAVSNGAQRTGEILRDESWQPEADMSDGVLAVTEGTEINRKAEPRRALMLLPASCDESSKRHGPSVSLMKIKERRKVLLVEQPGPKTTVRRVASANSSRPLSADDIQKAKMRAVFMQDKYRKADMSKSDDKWQKLQNQPYLPNGPNLKKLVGQNSSSPTLNNLTHQPENLASSEPKSTNQENLMEKLKRGEIRWRTPPEVRIDPSWMAATGDGSKERDIQTQRNQREKETFYLSPQDIPLNPKEPWDMEMDFDDSLTPEIPTEQPPDGDVMEDDTPRPAELGEPPLEVTLGASPSVPPPLSNVAAEADLELLAVLLGNPELVFALTSGQGKSLPSEQTVALLDLLKQNGSGLAKLVNGMENGSVGKPRELESEPKPERIPASLPSPTPPTDPAARASWRSEFPTSSKASFLQPHLDGSRRATMVPTAEPQMAPSAAVILSEVAEAHSRTSILPLPQLTVTINPAAEQHLPAVNSMYPSGSYVLSSSHRSLTNGPATLPSSKPQLPSVAGSRPFDSRASSSWPASATSITSNGRDVAPHQQADWLSDNIDVLDPNPPYFANQHEYNGRHSGLVATSHASPSQILGRRSKAVAPLEFDGSHEMPMEFRARWNHRPELSRPWNSADRDYHRSGRGRRRHGRDHAWRR